MTASENLALIHLAWHREGDVRHLVFGWIEMLPRCFPPLHGHTYVCHAVKRRGPYLNVARFPVTATEARNWFDKADGGALVLPSFAGSPTPGDGKPINIPKMVREPPTGTISTALQLPFLPKTQATATSIGLFGEPSACVKLALADQPSSAWLSRILFFDLTTYPEFLGGLFLVSHQPVLRDVATRRHVRAGKEAELVRTRRWPGTQYAKHRLLAVERRTLGYGVPVEQEITTGLSYVMHSAKQDRTAVAVLHPDYGVCWFREPLPWLRTIVTSTEMIGAHRRIVQEVDETGVARRYFDVPLQNRLNVNSVIGEVPDEGSPSYREARSMAVRRASATAAAIGLRWFDEPSSAQEAIRSIIGSARHSLAFFDSYFGPFELRDFVMAVRGSDVTITVVTSAEGLCQSLAEDTSIRREDLMENFLNQIKNDHHIRLEVLVMPGIGQLHDRFIEADGRVWLSGNSLNAIGARASMLIEVPNPDYVLAKLRPIQKNAQSFVMWLQDRRAARMSTYYPTSENQQNPNG